MTLNMDGWIILFLIGWLMVTDIMVNSFEFYLHPDIEASRTRSCRSSPTACRSSGTRSACRRARPRRCNVFFWYQHLLDFLIFLCYLPFSKHSHVLTIAPQVFYAAQLEPTGSPGADRRHGEAMEAARRSAPASSTDFNWKQLLDSYTCTECGRCTAACPANLTGKLLSPKHVIVDIRHLMEEQMVMPAFLKAAHAATKPSQARRR